MEEAVDRKIAHDLNVMLGTESWKIRYTFIHARDILTCALIF